MRFAFALVLICLSGPGYYVYGQSWTVYDPSNSGLPDGDLTEVVVGPADKPWVVTRTSGLAQLDGTTWRAYKSSNSGLPANSGINTISVDQDQALYVGYSASPSGVYRFDGNTWKKIPKFQKLAVSQIETDRHNTKWVCSQIGNNGLDSMVMTGTGTTFTQVDLGEIMRAALPPDSIDVARCFGVGVDDHHDRIWFGAHSISLNGYQTPLLVRYTPATNEWVVFPYAVTYSPWPITLNLSIPENLQIDASGGVWSSLNLNVGRRGLFYFNGTANVQYTTANSGLPSDHVNAVKLDKQGNLWVGTPSGLARFNGTDWLVLNTTNSGLPTDVIRDIDIDSQNQKWLATDRGLVVLNDIAPAITAPEEAYLCNVNPIHFADASTSMGGAIVRWEWDFGDGEGHSDQRETDYIFQTAGQYTVKLTVWDAGGSVNTASKEISVKEGYSGDVPGRALNFTMTAGGQLTTTPDFVAYPNVPLTFKGDAGVTTTSWEFGDGQSSTDAQAVHAFSGVGEYTVTYTQADDRGCPGVSTVTVTVLDPFITDTVTPNGDGKNDRLYVVPLLYAPELRVVNRWGQAVYFTAAYGDGFSTGNLQDGQYYYEVMFPGSGKTYKGHFQVIR